MKVLIGTDKPYTNYDDFKSLLGTIVHIKYPFLRRARILAFILENNEILCKYQQYPECIYRAEDKY